MRAKSYIEDISTMSTSTMKIHSKMKYVLLVSSGAYSSDSFIQLLWEMLTHRFEHLMRGDGWKD